MVGLANHFTLDSTIKLAVQCDLINKPAKPISDYLLGKHGHGWDNTELSIRQLRKHIIESGFAFSTASLTSGNRKTENFKSSSGILLDFDENTSLVDAQNNPVLRSIATAGYTTPSHTAENPRCKILCLYDRPVTDASLQRRYTELVMKLVADMKPDTSGKDATRFSYGNQDGEWLFVGNGLSVDKLNQMIANEAIEAESKKAKKHKIAIVQPAKKQPSDSTMLEELSRQIADTLGVSSYNDNQSNHVPCPCGHHNNGDANPSAVWNRDTHTLRCYTNSTTYNALETAKLLKIDIKNQTARRGLWNNTRRFFLNYSYENENGNTVKPFTSLCRFFDAMIMYGVGPGWYTIKDLDTALDGLFSDRTLRYSIATNLLSSKDYTAMIADTTGGKGLICICVPLLDHLSLSSKVDKNAKNYLTIPKLPEQDTKNKPATLYYVPSEQDLQTALKIDRGIYHDWLNLEDLKTNGKYTAAIVRTSIEQRTGQTKKTLSKESGLTGRSINRKVKEDPTLQGKRNERSLGVITDDSTLPIEPDYSRYLMAVDTRTGELKPSPYCLSSFLYRKKFTDKVYAFQHMATTYFSNKGKLAKDLIKLDMFENEDKAS